jgi:hypothetical protein
MRSLGEPPGGQGGLQPIAFLTVFNNAPRGHSPLGHQRRVRSP